MPTKDLQQMNRETFDAEERKGVGGDPWDVYLGHALADDFRIRRSNPAVALQDKKDMIDWIRTHPPAARVVSDVVVFEDGNYGVVTCVIELPGQPDRFHNLKVFVRDGSSGDWRCSYWQVAKL
jgi:hypothetical protein